MPIVEGIYRIVSIMVGIIILNYNNSAQTGGCLESLYRCCTGRNFRVCVVDNASREEEKAKLSEICTNGEHIIYSSENGGYARGNNLGCEWFDIVGEVDKILIINDDTRFTMDIITPLEKYLDSHPECGVAFPRVNAPDGTMESDCARKSKSTRDLLLQATRLERFGIRRKEFIPISQVEGKDAVRTGVPPGSCMMIPKAVFKKVGWLDPNTFLYFEEHILSEKLKKLSLECVLLPGISIIHLGAGTTKKQKSSAIYRHWRNSYLYYIRNFTDTPAVLRLYMRLRTGLKTLL